MQARHRQKTKFKLKIYKKTTTKHSGVYAEVFEIILREEDIMHSLYSKLMHPVLNFVPHFDLQGFALLTQEEFYFQLIKKKKKKKEKKKKIKVENNYDFFFFESNRTYFFCSMNNTSQ